MSCTPIFCGLTLFQVQCELIIRTLRMKFVGKIKYTEKYNGISVKKKASIWMLVILKSRNF